MANEMWQWKYVNGNMTMAAWQWQHSNRRMAMALLQCVAIVMLPFLYCHRYGQYSTGIMAMSTWQWQHDSGNMLTDTRN